MIIQDKKNMMPSIMARLAPKTGDMEMMHDADKPKEPDMDEDKEGLKAVAEDIMRAMESKDAHALALALHDFVEMAMDMPQEDEEEAPPAPESQE